MGGGVEFREYQLQEEIIKADIKVFLSYSSQCSWLTGRVCVRVLWRFLGQWELFSRAPLISG